MDGCVHGRCWCGGSCSRQPEPQGQERRGVGALLDRAALHRAPGRPLQDRAALARLRAKVGGGGEPRPSAKPSVQTTLALVSLLTSLPVRLGSRWVQGVRGPPAPAGRDVRLQRRLGPPRGERRDRGSPARLHDLTTNRPGILQRPAHPRHPHPSSTCLPACQLPHLRLDNYMTSETEAYGEAWPFVDELPTDQICTIDLSESTNRLPVSEQPPATPPSPARSPTPFNPFRTLTPRAPHSDICACLPACPGVPALLPALPRARRAGVLEA